MLEIYNGTEDAGNIQQIRPHLWDKKLSKSFRLEILCQQWWSSDERTLTLNFESFFPQQMRPDLLSISSVFRFCSALFTHGNIMYCVEFNRIETDYSIAYIYVYTSQINFCPSYFSLSEQNNFLEFVFLPYVLIHKFSNVIMSYPWYR